MPQRRALPLSVRSRFTVAADIWLLIEGVSVVLQEPADGPKISPVEKPFDRVVGVLSRLERVRSEPMGGQVDPPSLVTLERKRDQR